MSHISPPSESTSPGRSNSTRVRQAFLVGLMLLMLAALWYDYKVARPAVEDAYQRITNLNNRINSAGGHKYMTSADVQQELGRDPIDTYSTNGYYVEVYGWRAGLPTKHHKYFAVYTDVTPHIFKTHAMTQLESEIVQDGTIEVVADTQAPPPGFGKGPELVLPRVPRGDITDISAGKGKEPAETGTASGEVPGSEPAASDTAAKEPAASDAAATEPAVADAAASDDKAGQDAAPEKTAPAPDASQSATGN